jgi:hypothetical protein
MGQECSGGALQRPQRRWQNGQEPTQSSYHTFQKWLYARSGRTHIIHFDIFSKALSINAHTMCTGIERKYKVLNLVSISTWPHAERPVLMQLEGSLLVRVDDTQLVVIMVNAPGHLGSILQNQLLVIARQRKLNSSLQAREPAA